MGPEGSSAGWSTRRSNRTFRFGTRADGTFSRSDFIFDPEQDQYICPAGKVLKQFRRNYAVARTDSAHDGIRKYRASQRDCQICELKSRCCPNMLSRNVQRSVHEEARDRASQRNAAVQAIPERAEEGRDAVRASQDHYALRAIQTDNGKRPDCGNAEIADESKR
jgi:hypothetical protein